MDDQDVDEKQNMTIRGEANTTYLFSNQATSTPLLVFLCNLPNQLS
jgi:hypothetical protein